MDPDKINKILYSLYDDVSTAEVSINCRKNKGVYDDKTLVYGDSYLPSLREIFDEVKPQPGEVFYDLGSGGGRVVLFAALNYQFSRCIGVELLDDLFILAQKKLEELRAKKSAEFDNINEMAPVEFINSDFTKIDLSRGNVFYIASTCFDAKLMHDLAACLEIQLQRGARVITATKALPSKMFKITRRDLFPMEWGAVTIFFHEKI